MEALRIQFPGESDTDLLIRALDEIKLQKERLASPTPALSCIEGKKSIVLPKPPVFKGNRESFPIWKNKMKAKLQRDGHIIGTDGLAQVDYICAFLEEEAAMYLEHYTKQMGNNITVEGVWAYLDRRYDDPHRAQRAKTEHEKLKQGNKTFPEFIAELDRLQSEAGIDLYPDSVKVDILKGKISSELIQLSVANVNLPSSNYAEVVRYFNQLHNNLVAAKEQGAYRYDIHGNRAKEKNFTKPMTTPPAVIQHVAAGPLVTKKDPNEMEWASTNKGAFGVAQGQHQQDRRPCAPPISETEFQLRKQKGACFTCGNPGHISRNCYYAPPPRRNFRVNQVATVMPQIVVYEESVKEKDFPNYDEQSKALPQ